MLLKEKHKKFNKSRRRHILIITNHGCHSPIIKVTTDTGGQNFYVNDLCKALLKLGYKVTILNRGGYKHPTTGVLHKGVVYYDDVWKRNGIYCRIVYLEDGINKFIPKEQLTYDNLQKEKRFFFKIVKKINIDLRNIYFISSHYWDAGVLGIFIDDELKKKLGFSLPHIWTPHSLGILKKKNYKNAPEDVVKALNFPFRIKNEKKIISTVDGVVSTSSKIHKTLTKYGSKIKNHFWFPPGVDVKLFKPRKLRRCKNGIKVLKDALKLKRNQLINLITNKVLFLEVSRTAKSKQKDLVLKSFSRIKSKDSALLAMTVDKEPGLYEEILELYKRLKNRENIVILDRFLTKEEISEIFSLADVYVTASLMEGWGMAVQEAAASKCAIISSKFVPFVTEVLKDNAFIVNKNSPRLYAEKMDILIEEPNLRKRLASKCYKIVKKHYSWYALTTKLIKKMKRRKIIK